MLLKYFRRRPTRFLARRYYAQNPKPNITVSDIRSALHNRATFPHDVQSHSLKNFPPEVILEEIQHLDVEEIKVSEVQKRDADQRLKEGLNRLDEQIFNHIKYHYDTDVREHVMNLRNEIKKLGNVIDHYWDTQDSKRKSDVESERYDWDTDLHEETRRFKDLKESQSTYDRHPELKRKESIESLRKEMKNFWNVLDNYWDPEEAKLRKEEQLEGLDKQREGAYESLDKFIKEEQVKSNEEPGWRHRADEAKEHGLEAPKNEGWDRVDNADETMLDNRLDDVEMENENRIFVERLNKRPDEGRANRRK